MKMNVEPSIASPQVVGRATGRRLPYQKMAPIIRPVITSDVQIATTRPSSGEPDDL